VEIAKKDYIRKVLDAYRRTPGTTGAVRRSDRLLAVALYDRGVSATTVENALILAASRRIFRPPDAVPLQPIRSLHYLLPVIEELLQLRISQDYFRYLQFHIDRVQQKNTTD
jgi:glycine/D-amino acid oxidase-like deaminating enzyme